MSLLILLLLGEVLLDFLHVQELGAEFEGQGQLVAENLSVTLNLGGVPGLQLAESLGILLLSLEQVLVPLLVELLVLLNVGLLTLFALLGLVEDKLLVPSIIILLLELSDTILGHLSLHVLAFALTGVSVVLENLAVGKENNDETDAFFKG